MKYDVIHCTFNANGTDVIYQTAIRWGWMRLRQLYCFSVQILLIHTSAIQDNQHADKSSTIINYGDVG